MQSIKDRLRLLGDTPDSGNSDDVTDDINEQPVRKKSRNIDNRPAWMVHGDVMASVKDESSDATTTTAKATVSAVTTDSTQHATSSSTTTTTSEPKATTSTFVDTEIASATPNATDGDRVNNHSSQPATQQSPTEATNNTRPSQPKTPTTAKPLITDLISTNVTSRVPDKVAMIQTALKPLPMGPQPVADNRTEFEVWLLM